MLVELEEQLQLDALLTAIESQLQQDLPDFSIRNLFFELLQGSLKLDIVTLLEQIGQLVWGDITVQFSFIGKLILLAIMAALLRQMENSFSDGSIQKVSGLMLQSVAILLLLESGSAVLAYGQQAVLRLAEVMQALLPVQLLLMTGLGNVQTAGLLKPSLLLIVQVAVWFYKTVLLPVITMEFVLKLINSFSDICRMQRLAALLRKIILTVIAFSTMLFLAVLSIQGISGHIMDSLSVRTVKYMAGNLIPVVGGTISGLFDTFMSGALMIRSAVGFVGLLAILLLTMIPAVKLLLLYFMYNLTAAVLQPVGDDRITVLLEQTADTFMLLFAVVALTGVFFFFMILIVLAASGSVFQ